MPTILKKCTARALLMSNTILFVFEGERLEKEIFNSIKANFFTPSNGRTVIKSFFCGEIFQLWNKVKDDEYLDIVEILKERPNSEIKDVKRDEVSEIHLFFDHDAHSRPSESQQEYHEKISSLLDTFNNETEAGKLWISYPMAEAIKHCKKNPADCFFDAQIQISDYAKYKKTVSDISDYLDIKKFDLSTWYYLAAVNIQRAFCLVNDTHKAISDYNNIKTWFEEDTTIVRMIHESQYNKFIHPKNEIVALSPFPLFLLHYYGERFFIKCKCDEVIKTCSFFCYK